MRIGVSIFFEEKHNTTIMLKIHHIIVESNIIILLLITLLLARIILNKLNLLLPRLFLRCVVFRDLLRGPAVVDRVVAFPRPDLEE
jgi:hypothetical protein